MRLGENTRADEIQKKQLFIDINPIAKAYLIREFD